MFNQRSRSPFSLGWRPPKQSTGRLLGARQRLASHESREPLKAEPELTTSRRAADNLLLATLELINVPSGEDNLVLEKLRFGGGNPDEEVGGKRDCGGGGGRMNR